MTKREINMKIFEKKKIPGIFFQPRMEWWYLYHKMKGTLPETYSKMSLLDFFDDIDVSIRYFSYATGLPEAKEKKYTEAVKVEELTEDREKTVSIFTPGGNLVSKLRLALDGDWRIVKFPVETPEDIENALWLFENIIYSFSKDNFEKGAEFVGERGEPQIFLPRSGYSELLIEWMGFENLIYGLADYPDKIEMLMRVIDSSQDSFFEEITAYGKIKIVNFGENVDSSLFPPRYFEKYCIPYYEKRARQLKKAGIYTHIHIDGDCKSLLKYFKDLSFDGFEALTPLSQGDVTLEEIKEAIGDKILLDGIPAIFLLPNYPIEEFQAFTKKLIEMFYPNLILGVSDEVPPPADIERIRWISRYCRQR